MEKRPVEKTSWDVLKENPMKPIICPNCNAEVIPHETDFMLAQTCLNMVWKLATGEISFSPNNAFMLEMFRVVYHEAKEDWRCLYNNKGLDKRNYIDNQAKSRKRG